MTGEAKMTQAQGCDTLFENRMIGKGIAYLTEQDHTRIRLSPHDPYNQFKYTVYDIIGSDESLVQKKNEEMRKLVDTDKEIIDALGSKRSKKLLISLMQYISYLPCFLDGGHEEGYFGNHREALFKGAENPKIYLGIKVPFDIFKYELENKEQSSSFHTAFPPLKEAINLLEKKVPYKKILGGFNYFTFDNKFYAGGRSVEFGGIENLEEILVPCLEGTAFKFVNSDKYLRNRNIGPPKSQGLGNCYYRQSREK